MGDIFKEIKEYCKEIACSECNIDKECTSLMAVDPTYWPDKISETRIRKLIKGAIR